MDLEIIFMKDNRVAVKLSESGKEIDLLMIPLDIHFDTMLVTSIDKILKRNRIESSSLKTVKVGGSANQSSVAFHIAEAVVAALKTQIK